jgi:hypothetical protein
MKITWRDARTALISGIVAGLVAGGGVYAADKIYSRDIKNDTIRAWDVRNNTLKLKDLSPEAREDMQEAREAAASHFNPQWGIITRNHIGSAVADLRPGPYGTFGIEGDQAEPPYGVGSLGIAVSDEAMTGTSKEEKATFGNEVDFLGDPFGELQEVGFQVFQTNENNDRGANNMPNITFEIDPNLESSASNYSSAVFVPNGVDADNRNRWSPYIDATQDDSGWWYLTGAAGTASGCDQAAQCTFQELQTALDDGGDGATIYTAAVAKGRDDAWVGAVDGLRINNTIYNFEPNGVRELNAS